MMTNVANFKHPEFLVSVDWLLENLEDPNLRIYDCTAHLIPHPTETYTIGSGKGDYEKAHIPGADFWICSKSYQIIQVNYVYISKR